MRRMLRWCSWLGPVLTIGAAGWQIGLVASGDRMTSTDQIWWPTLVIIWVVLAWVNQKTHQINQRTIERQRKELDQHRERYAHDIRGRWN